ncbi:MAG: hypothetical protein ACQEVA_04495 [Myxococcota bacterium]
MTADTYLKQLSDKLTGMNASVEEAAGTLNVAVGRGITASKANVDPSELVDILDQADEDERNRLIAGYASGVKHVLLEPKRSDAAEWSYEKTAGRLMPSVEVHTFTLGAAAASGGQAWTKDYHEDLVMAYLIELDLGMRVLTESQVDDWGVTSDRVTAAGRSLLFHKSRNLKATKLDDFPVVERFSVGDEYDAARGLVVADVFFSEFDDDFRFATPTKDDFLFVRDDDAASIEALCAATDARFDEAEYPISRSLYTFELGKPVLDVRR